MIYALGDLHLSLSANKKMDVFGNGWEGYEQKLLDGLSRLSPEDTLILCGDSSWGLNMREALEDFRFIDRIPGQKILVKGNHDYFWETKTKLDGFFRQNGLESIRILHNNAYLEEGLLICGTRGWGEPLDTALYARELGRLRFSLEAGRKLSPDAPIAVFLHYPPLCADICQEEFLSLFEEYRVSYCCYGHLHGGAHAKAFEGTQDGVQYRLVSADYLRFAPLALC